MKVVTGIGSTTHLDRHGHIVSKSVLEDMARQINDHYIPLDIEHRGTYIGVVLAGMVKQLDDGEFGLSVALGIFDDPKDSSAYQYGQENTSCDQYLPLLKDA